VGREGGPAQPADAAAHPLLVSLTSRARKSSAPGRLLPPARVRAGQLGGDRRGYALIPALLRTPAGLINSGPPPPPPSIPNSALASPSPPATGPPPPKLGNQRQNRLIGRLRKCLEVFRHRHKPAKLFPASIFNLDC
jgi:hypothetical protein